MQAPVNSGSSFFNYKRTHSVVLLAICDAQYHFILVDIVKTTAIVMVKFWSTQALENGTFYIPIVHDSPLPGTTQPNLPYVIIGDVAFPLKLNMLRLYPEKNLLEPEAIFNYRLSRACHIIENSFGLLAAKWLLFRRPIIANPNTVVRYTKATITLLVSHLWRRSKLLPGQYIPYCPVVQLTTTDTWPSCQTQTPHL